MYLILGLSSLWEKAAYGLIWQSTHSLLLLGSELQRSWIYFRAYVQIPNPINLSWLPLNTSLTKDKHFTRSAKTESTNLWLHRCFYAAQRCNYKLFCSIDERIGKLKNCIWLILSLKKVMIMIFPSWFPDVAKHFLQFCQNISIIH